MTSFCIASRSVSHSLIETGILWSLSLTKNPESMRVKAAGLRALARHEDEALEEVHVLLVLEQRAVQGRDDGLAVVGKLDVGLVDLVDEEHDRRLRSERLPQHSAHYVVADLVHARVAELGIAQAAHRVVFVQSLLRLGRGLDVPFEERQVERLGHLHGEHGLAGARLAFYEQGALQSDRRVDREREVVGGDVSFGAFESHRSILGSGCASLYTIARCVHCFRCCCVLPLAPTRPRSPSTWAISSRSRARPARAGAPSSISTAISPWRSNPPRDEMD